MDSAVINLWIEGDVSTNRILSLLLNDIDSRIKCNTHLLSEIDLEILSAGVNVFCRICDPRYSWLPKYLCKQGVDYIYYIDDNFWEISGDSDLARYYQSESVISVLDEFVSKSKIIIVNSINLYNFIGVRFPKLNCQLLSPPFDVSAIGDSFDDDSLNSTDGNLVIGYAGGYKHEEFELIEQVIQLLILDYPTLRFEFIGSCSNQLKKLRAVSWFPGFSDYKDFLRFKISRNWSIGLAPLFENRFNASKTNNKYREYGGCRIPGIYSDVIPYQQCVNDGINGVLVENKAEAWAFAIRNLIENSELRSSIKMNAFCDVKACYSHDAIAPEWKKVLTMISSHAQFTALERYHFFYLKRLYLQGDFANAKIGAQLEGRHLKFWLMQQWIRENITRQRLKLLFWIFMGVTLLNINFYILKSCSQ